jgi:cytochrome P450
MPLVKLRYCRAIRKALAHVNDLSEEILRHSKDAPAIEALHQARSEGALSHEQVLDNVRGLLIAGHETSATAASWSVSMLAQHPNLAESLVEERRLTESAGSLKDTMALTKAHRWARETIRLYPPAPVSISQAMEDTDLGGLFVPKGKRVDVCSYAIHRLPWLWENVGAFNPDRFTEHPRKGTYIPFLHGPHTCLGIRLAEIEVPLLTARLAGAFLFSFPKGPPSPNLRVSLHPSGLLVQVRKR